MPSAQKAECWQRVFTAKLRAYCRVSIKGVGDKPQIHSNLVFEFGVFLKGKNKEAEINHCLVTFL